MNPDTQKIIDICEDPLMQKAVREAWPDYYMGYVFKRGRIEIISTRNIDGDEYSVFIPTATDFDRCCSQIDVLIMEELNIKDPGILSIKFREKFPTSEWEYLSRDLGSIGYSDLYLKFLWLAELLDKKEGEKCSQKKK